MAASCASVGGSPPAGANVSASLKRGALGEYCSPAHCTTRGALAHLGVYSHCAQKYGFFPAKAGASRAGGAPPASENKRFQPGRGGRARYGKKKCARRVATTPELLEPEARAAAWRAGGASGVLLFLSFESTALSWSFKLCRPGFLTFPFSQVRKNKESSTP
jgi:hypothetical protein